MFFIIIFKRQRIFKIFYIDFIQIVQVSVEGVSSRYGNFSARIVSFFYRIYIFSDLQKLCIILFHILFKGRMRI